MTGWHLLHVFSCFDPGGMEVRSTMVMDLLPPPHRHTIVAMSGRTGAAARIRRAQVELLPPPPKAGFMRSVQAMAQRVRALRPDLVLTYNWGAIETVAACRLVGHRALIHHEEGFSTDEVQRLLPRRTWTRRALLRWPAAVIVPSTVLERIAREVWWVRPQRVRYLVNGVDLEHFHPRDPAANGATRDPAANGAARGPVTVGTVARFRPEKDLGALVEAFARCANRSEARLVLVGEGPELEAVRARAVACGVAAQTEFRGHRGDTAPAYRELDVFAMSSRTEQMPLVVLEAMATGLPVVAPDVGDIKQMVAPANHPWIVPRGDLAALTRALDAAIASAEQRAAIGAQNRAHCAERFELSACLRAHLDLYERVVGG
jgi:glycosyltransferase involved in cell wall biosynthesis